MARGPLSVVLIGWIWTIMDDSPHVFELQGVVFGSDG